MNSEMFLKIKISKKIKIILRKGGDYNGKEKGS